MVSSAQVAHSIEEALQEGKDILHLSRVHDELPRDILKIPNLRELKLDHCHLDVPVWLADISTLERLVLNSVHDVGEFLQEAHRLTSLRALKLCWVDGLENGLPDSFAEMKRLEELHFDSVNLPDVPDSVAHLPRLKSFTLKYCSCDLDTLVGHLASEKSLVELSLERCQGETLPDSIACLTELETLDLSDCVALKSLPEAIGALKKLKTLNLAVDPDVSNDGHLERLPDALCDLVALEHLNLFNCEQVRELPPRFDNLKKLRFLDVRMTGLAKVPLTADQLETLEILHIQGEFPDVSRCPNLKEFTYLRNRDCYWREHEHILPTDAGDDVFDMPGLPDHVEDLNVCGGKLRDTAFLSRLARLRHLHLHCDLDRLPDDIGALKNLETFSLWGAMSLHEMPASMTELTALKELHFNGHPFVRMPDGLQEMENLHYVDWNDEIFEKDADDEEEDFDDDDL